MSEKMNENEWGGNLNPCWNEIFMKETNFKWNNFVYWRMSATKFVHEKAFMHNQFIVGEIQSLEWFFEIKIAICTLNHKKINFILKKFSKLKKLA